MNYRVELERQHCLEIDDPDAKVYFDFSATSVECETAEEAVQLALDKACNSQYYVFGDTGMDDGKYEIKVLGVYIPVPESEWKSKVINYEMKECSGT